MCTFLLIDLTLRHPWKCLALAVKIILKKAGQKFISVYQPGASWWNSLFDFIIIYYDKCILCEYDSFWIDRWQDNCLISKQKIEKISIYFFAPTLYLSSFFCISFKLIFMSFSLLFCHFFSISLSVCPSLSFSLYL